MRPRYIKNDGRFYSFNVIDLFSHRVYVESQRSKGDRQGAASLMRCWKTVGMPDFLQLDNELSFRGSNCYPRSMRLIIRLCLYYGVALVFIPIGEPWRNGVMESFNNTYDKRFYRRQWFPSYTALKRQSKNFQSFQNKHHRYSCLKGRTPSDIIQEAGFNPITLALATKLPKLDHVPDGEVVLVRFIRNDRKLDVFSEQFKVPRDLIYSYVKAVILTETHTLHVYQGEELVLTFDYEIPDQENLG